MENGCTRVVPGSHHLPAFANLKDDAIQEIAASQAIPLPMLAGGLLAIDSMINPFDWHQSDRRHTDEYDARLSQCR